MQSGTVIGAVILLVFAIAVATRPSRRRRRTRRARIARARAELERDFRELGAATSEMPALAGFSRRIGEAGAAVCGSPPGVSAGRAIYRGLARGSGLDDLSMLEAAAAFRSIAADTGDARMAMIANLFEKTAADIRILGIAVCDYSSS